MSNSLSIAAVTATLRNILQAGFTTGTEVSTLPMEKADDFSTALAGDSRINLFLYRTQVSGAWRNQEMPGQGRPNETRPPPLALDLFYLLTAHEKSPGDPTIRAHRALGRAMLTLHDHPLLNPAEINSALGGNDLAAQPERVRVQPLALTLDDLSKLWTVFQTEYRPAVAYQVSVVLIESGLGAKTPLPVLTRGQDDRGAVAQASLTPAFPFPTILALQPPEPQAGVELGEMLTVTGHDLAGSTVELEIEHPLLPSKVKFPAQAGATATEFKVTVVDQPAGLPAGNYLARAVITTGAGADRVERRSNDMAFALSPKIAAGSIAVVRNSKEVTVTLGCMPRVKSRQRVALLLGDRELVGTAVAAPPNGLQFIASTVREELKAGDYFVRLRVDGVDSRLILFLGNPPVPSFDPAQKATVP